MTNKPHYVLASLQKAILKYILLQPIYYFLSVRKSFNSISKMIDSKVQLMQQLCAIKIVEAKHSGMENRLINT